LAARSTDISQGLSDEVMESNRQIINLEEEIKALRAKKAVK